MLKKEIKTYVACAVVLSKHEALVKRLSALLGIEGGLVQHHAALLARGHLVAEGSLAPQGQHGGRGRLEVWTREEGSAEVEAELRGEAMASLTVFAILVRDVFVLCGVVGGGDVLVSKFFYGVDVQHDVVLVACTFALRLQLDTQGHTTDQVCQ